MPKKKSSPKSKCNDKKCYSKKCSKVEIKDEATNDDPIVNLPTKTNYFFDLIKKVFGYE
jgi:hypothetical protein